MGRSGRGSRRWSSSRRTKSWGALSAESPEAFSRFKTVDGLPNYNGQMLVFFIITVAAAEVAVGLAIIVALFRARRTVHVEDITSMRG